MRSLNIKDPEAYRLAAAIARETEETIPVARLENCLTIACNP